jgi:hypothetical protein
MAGPWMVASGAMVDPSPGLSGAPIIRIQPLRRTMAGRRCQRVTEGRQGARR